MRNVVRHLCSWLGAASMLLGLDAPAAAQRVSELRAETVRIPGPVANLQLGLRHVAPRATDRALATVLILHGANIPTSGNADFPVRGRSMMQALAETGLDVWGLDFYGFGASDRYPQMEEAPDRNPPLGTVAEAADQVASAIRFLRARNGGRPIMLVGDSFGSLAAGVHAAREPASIARLVLFGPVTPFTSATAAAAPPAYRLVTPEQLWAVFGRWSSNAGPPEALDQSLFEDWARTFLDSDPTSRTRTPNSVRVPNGTSTDLPAIANGRFPYEPGRIQAPTLIVMGDVDEVATYAGAQWLLGALRNARQRRLTVIGHGSHTIQYETGRGQLYATIAAFLHETD